MSFLRDQVRRFYIRKELEVIQLFLYVEVTRLYWLRQMTIVFPRCPIWSYFMHVQVGGNPEATLEHTTGFTYPNLAWESLRTDHKEPETQTYTSSRKWVEQWIGSLALAHLCSPEDLLFLLWKLSMHMWWLDYVYCRGSWFPGNQMCLIVMIIYFDWLKLTSVTKNVLTLQSSLLDNIKPPADINGIKRS